MQLLKPSTGLLLFVLAFVSLRTSAQPQCQNGNNYSLLKGSFGFHFQAQIPQVVQNQAVLRPASVVGQAVYSGDGKAYVLLNGSVTTTIGKIQELPTLALTGTYCIYGNGWGTASFTDDKGNVALLFHFVATGNGQDLETHLVRPQSLQWTATCSQKKL